MADYFAIRGSSRSKFLMIIRHPLANALAHRPFLTGRRSIGDLVANWLAVAEYIEQDMPHLQNKMLLKLEDLVAGAISIEES